MSTPETPISESRSSVEISTTAAGKPLVRVKVYADSVGIEAADAAAAKAIELYHSTNLGVGALV